MNSQEVTELSNMRILLNPALTDLCKKFWTFSCVDSLSMHAMIFSISTWSLNQLQWSVFNFWNTILANIKLMFRTRPSIASFIQTRLWTESRFRSIGLFDKTKFRNLKIRDSMVVALHFSQLQTFFFGYFGLETILTWWSFWWTGCGLVLFNFFLVDKNRTYSINHLPILQDILSENGVIKNLLDNRPFAKLTFSIGWGRGESELNSTGLLLVRIGETTPGTSSDSSIETIVISLFKSISSNSDRIASEDLSLLIASSFSVLKSSIEPDETVTMDHSLWFIDYGSAIPQNIINIRLHSISIPFLSTLRFLFHGSAKNIRNRHRKELKTKRKCS